ncbi:hypothetical protein HF086_012176 [Spodoptera exigua]|uniref:Cytochrome p450 n=1 Tax=Spodoptera exigua TaxID=7107 RepID=A0A922M7E8_SPOEX|nr:hypothetical protein HF086_012176 [Spodoptera exigua]
MLWLTFTLVIAAGFLSWQYWRWRHRRMLELAAKLPGPPALPILGNALSFMFNPGGIPFYFLLPKIIVGKFIPKVMMIRRKLRKSKNIPKMVRRKLRKSDNVVKDRIDEDIVFISKKWLLKM